MDDDGDGQQPNCSGGPLADSQGPAGGSAQDIERGSTHAVDSEAWDGHRSQSLPHEGVYHSHSHPGAAACFRTLHLVGRETLNPVGVEAENPVDKEYQPGPRRGSDQLGVGIRGKGTALVLGSGLYIPHSGQRMDLSTSKSRV